MPRETIAVNLAWAILLAPAAAFSQDAAQILQKVGDTYRGLTSYHFEGTTVAETNAGGAVSSSETSFVVAYTAPKKFRVEFRYSNGGTWIRVSDGSMLSRYRSLTKELKQEAAGDDLSILNGTMVAGFQDIGEGVKKAVILPPDSIEVGNHKVDCEVIQVERQPAQSPLLPGTVPLPETLWIDKARFLILRRVSGTKSIAQSENRGTQNTRTTTFSVAQVNQPVEPTLFALNVKKK